MDDVQGGEGMHALRQANHRATTPDREVIEPRAARRSCDSGVRDTQVTLHESRHPAVLEESRTRAERHPQDHGILRSLGYVDEALHGPHHHTIADGVSDAFGQSEEFFVRNVVVPGFERGDGFRLEAPAALRERTRRSVLRESRSRGCGKRDRGVKYR